MAWVVLFSDGSTTIIVPQEYQSPAAAAKEAAERRGLRVAGMTIEGGR